MGLLREARQARLLKKVTKGKRIQKDAPEFTPSSMLQSTEKVGKAALLIQERCNACHGKTVRDVLGSMVNNGGRYSMADLKYDIKNGRLAVLKPGVSAGPPPLSKARKDAPCAGKPMPPASLNEFFQFLQCQLRMQTKEHTGNDVEIKDKDALKMWPEVVAFVTPNLGLTERWVPYHTILGVHELFLVESVHHNSKTKWNEKQRFIAMFIFRAHCKRDLFTRAQLPLMLNDAFWKDPVKAFLPGGPMEKAILKYRRTTKQPLLTSCFRIIPRRILKDDTENLVRSITNRTMELIEVANQAFPIIKDSKRKAMDKMSAISSLVQNGVGLGETWGKMITVCIDLAYPKERLLETQCDVGTGAAQPLKVLLPKGGPTDKKEALKALLKIANGAKNDSTKHFWSVLKKVESQVCTKFKKYPLILAQATTRQGHLTACTLQVQLCEYRQFRHSLARNCYGLPDDETMRVDTTTEMKLHAEDFVEYDKKRSCAKFDFPKDGKKISFEVPAKCVGGSQMVAESVAAMCFKKFSDGMAKPEVQKFCDAQVKDYKGGLDVKASSGAWEVCKPNLEHASPLCSFRVECKGGSEVNFQTTVGAAGGSMLEAQRIARLCWEKLVAGAKKEAVVEYRNSLYKKLSSDEQPAKKQRTH